MVIVLVHGRQVHTATRTVQSATDGLAPRHSLLRVQVWLKARNGGYTNRRQLMMIRDLVETGGTEQHADGKDADRV